MPPHLIQNAITLSRYKHLDPVYIRVIVSAGSSHPCGCRMSASILNPTSISYLTHIWLNKYIKSQDTLLVWKTEGIFWVYLISINIYLSYISTYPTRPSPQNGFDQLGRVEVSITCTVRGWTALSYPVSLQHIFNPYILTLLRESMVL